MLYDVTAQYDYENEGSIVAAMMAGGAPYVGSSTASRSLSSGTGQLSQQDKMQWDRTNALTLEKCLQLQKLAIKKRNCKYEALYLTSFLFSKHYSQSHSAIVI